MGEEGKEVKKNTFLAALSFWSQIGVTMVACVFCGVFIGIFLDKLFHSSPWLLLIFSLLGVLAAFRSIFMLGKK